MKRNKEAIERQDAAIGNPFAEAGERLSQMEAEGALPEGFELRAACQDREFALLVQEFPVEAAVRIYAAEKRAEEAERNAVERVRSQLKSRDALPKSQRGGGSIAATPDYMSMSSEAFRSLEKNLKSAARRGAKPKI
ncbi:MAG: hypothetical protein Q4C01_07190 [Clostridia bacterium]|nr:hypothetical protein [Clostridia bacterium]